VKSEHDASEPTATLAAPAAVGAGRSRWVGYGIGALALALTAFAYRALLSFRPTGSITVEVEGWFFEPSDTAATLVIGLALWLLYRRSGRLAALAWAPGSPWLTGALYAVAAVIHGWSLATGASDLQALSLVLACFATANLLGGKPALRVVWPPVLFLLFALPIPSPLRHALVWKFQIWTAEATGWLLYMLGIPAVVSGDRILMADTVFAVIETCSGLRSVITLSMLAVLMVDLFRRSGVHAALVLGVAPVLAFGTNALRCLGLVLNPASNIATIHSLQGIGMLLFSVLVLYAFDGLLERLGVPGSHGGRRIVRLRQTVPRRMAWTAGFLVLLSVLSLLIVPWQIPSPSHPLPADVIPRRLDGWRSAELDTDRLFLGMAALTGSVDRRYFHAGNQVDVYVASGSPRLRLRSFYSPKTALPGSGWIVEERSLESRDGRSLDVLVVRKGSQRSLVHHWYLGTRGLLEETLRDAIGIDLSPFARPWRGGVVRLATPLEGPEGRKLAEQRLAAMTERLAPYLNQSSHSPGG
jgi:exosortase